MNGTGSRTPLALPLENSTSDAGITTSVTGNSSPVTERTEDEVELGGASASASEMRRPLAERLLPKPRKTGVEEYVCHAIHLPSLLLWESH